jgi:hypothetical protein
MNQRFWIAVVVCYVVNQIFGFLIHGVWLQPVYASLADSFRAKAEMDQMFWMMFLTSAALIYAFCYIFTKGYENKGIGEGVRYGLWIGLLVAIPQAYDSHVVYRVPFDLATKWAVTGVIDFVILGAVLAAIYRREPATP